MGAAAGIAAAADSSAPAENLMQVPAEYARCYGEGYRKVLRKKKVRSAVAGAIPGSVMWVLLVVAAL
jgi:hypothetical protein